MKTFLDNLREILKGITREIAASLIWPNHGERRELFEKASHYIKATSIKFIEGDGVALILKLSNQIPRDSVSCIFHTHVANQIPLENKKRLFRGIKSNRQR